MVYRHRLALIAALPGVILVGCSPTSTHPTATPTPSQAPSAQPTEPPASSPTPPSPSPSNGVVACEGAMLRAHFIDFDGAAGAEGGCLVMLTVRLKPQSETSASCAASPGSSNATLDQSATDELLGLNWVSAPDVPASLVHLNSHRRRQVSYPI